MAENIPLSDAKARLSEVIRTVRRTRKPIVITLDAEVATFRALWNAVLRIPRPDAGFSAVEWVAEGRR